MNYELRILNYGLNSFIVKITKYQLGNGYGYDARIGIRLRLRVVDYVTTSLIIAVIETYTPLTYTLPTVHRLFTILPITTSTNYQQTTINHQLFIVYLPPNDLQHVYGLGVGAVAFT
jgi:hypothetical protein